MTTDSDSQGASRPPDVVAPAELHDVHERWLQTGAVADWARAFRKAFDPEAGRALTVAYFRWIDPDDLPAMSAWAEGLCRSCTISQLARDFGVEAEREAIYEHLTRGFTNPATRRAIREACEQALDRTELSQERDSRMYE